MKKLFGLFVLLCFAAGLADGVSAQGTVSSVDPADKAVSNISPLPPDRMPPKFFGQAQWYSVVFRGNGEAVIDARITFSQRDPAPRKAVELRIPRVSPSDIYAYQVFGQSACQGVLQPDGSELQIMPCLETDSADVTSWYGPMRYQAARVSVSGDTATVTLPTQIKTGQTGQILLFYRATGYAKKNIFGAWEYAFETLKANEAVESVQIGVTTDSDLILRDSKGTVNYRDADTSGIMKEMAGAAAPMANSRMDSYAQQIGYGQVMRSASNLSALESYTVRGSFADSKFRLYARETLIGLGIFLAVAVLIAVFIRFLIRSAPPRAAAKPGMPPQSAALIAVFGLSFLSAVMMIGFTVILVYLTRNLSGYVGYEAQLPIVLLLLILSMGIYGFFLVAPSLFAGLRYGFGAGVGLAALTIGWLVMALVLFIFLSGRPIAYPTPVPVMRMFNGVPGGAETRSQPVDITEPAPAE